MLIPSKKSDRAVKILFRVYVDLGGKKHVKSIGGKNNPMIIRYDYSRYTWMYFISHKSDAADTIAFFCVVVIRSDDGGEFIEEKFG